MQIDVDLPVVRGEISNKGQYKLDASDLRRLWPEEKIFAVWLKPHPDGHLHVFVGLPVRLPPTPVDVGGECSIRLFP